MLFLPALAQFDYFIFLRLKNIIAYDISVLKSIGESISSVCNWCLDHLLKPHIVYVLQVPFISSEHLAGVGFCCFIG